MDGNETKNKILKIVTVALPILLVAFLAIMIFLAHDLADRSSQPVMGTGVSDTDGEQTTIPEEETSL